jgi:hypothetical protein
MTLEQSRRRWWTKITRDLTLFVLGVVFSINEILIRSGPSDPNKLIFITVLLGAPIALRFDESRRNRDK